MKIKKIPWPPWLTLTTAFLGLTFFLNFDYPAEHFFTLRLLLPSVDVWLLLLLMAAAACGGKRPLFWTTPPVWALFLVLRVIRTGDTAVPMYLNRPFNLYIDSGYLYGLYDLFKTSCGQGDFLLMSAALATVTLGVGAASWYAWQSAARAFMIKRVRLSFLGGSGLILGVALIWGGQTARPLALVRLGQEILSIQEQIKQQQPFIERLTQTASDRAAKPTSVNGLEGADVLLFIIESYGRIVFSRPQYRQAMDVTMANFAKILDQHDFRSVSSYLVSPTYGGSSWLAHGSLESGVRIGDDLENTALLRSSLPTMASYFRKSGYRTVSVMPGTRFAFPEGVYFGYDQAYYAWDFNYCGPTYGWAAMPDQFVLDWVRHHEFVKRDRPIFARYVLISSHAAFNVQPPYIADWEAIGDGGLFNEREKVYFPISWPELKNAGDGYLRSLDYEFTTLGDYLAKYVNTDTLVIIMGDHQPNLQLTGEGESWSVPAHIISRNPRLLTPFIKRGYTAGLAPAQPLPHAGMETFLPGFLEDFR